MGHDTMTVTVGEQLRQDPAIVSAIETIVDRVRAHAEQITDVRPGQPELKVTYDDLLQRAGAVKGRPLLYPSLNSGAGNGALVELADGSVKWDMITGIGVHFLGHAHPEVIRAQAVAALGGTTKHGNLQSGFGAYEFGERLVSLASRNSRIRHAFMTTSGAMANESALKVCYQKHFPASRVIAFEHCFMGRSVTMAQIGDSHAGREGIPLSTQVDYMPFWSDEAAERAGGATKYIDKAVARLQQYVDRYPRMHACFIFELVQGEGGFNAGNRDYFRALMECCKANNIAVWDDEIQCFGRTERLFAYEMYDLGEYVDVLTVGKMTQACTVLFTEDYNPKAGLLSGTFTGSTVDFTVGSALLDVLTSGDHYGPDGAFARHHAAFRRQVAELRGRHPEWFPGSGEVAGGVGGMMRFTPFGGDKAKVMKLCRAAYDEGVVLFYCGHGPYHVRMLPPLPVMRFEDWPRVFSVIERAMSRVSSEG